MKPEVKTKILTVARTSVPFVLLLGGAAWTMTEIYTERVSLDHQIDSQLPALPSVAALELDKAKQTQDAFTREVLEATEKRDSVTINAEKIKSAREALAVFEKQKAAEERQRERMALRTNILDQTMVMSNVKTFGPMIVGLSLGVILALRLDKKRSQMSQKDSVPPNS